MPFSPAMDNKSAYLNFTELSNLIENAVQSVLSMEVRSLGAKTRIVRFSRSVSHKFFS
jgi:hypothetical protein